MGNPTSSFDYHRAILMSKYLYSWPISLICFSEVESILMFDHVGFGFSDKPLEVNGGQIFHFFSLSDIIQIRFYENTVSINFIRIL